MEKAIIAICCFASFVGAAIAQEDEYKNLDGARYSITNQNLMDLAPDDKRDRVAIFIKGDTAKAIYNAMLTPARRVDCDGKPMDSFPPTKVAGGLECSGDDVTGYTCTVAIKLDSGETVTGYICDPQ